MKPSVSPIHPHHAGGPSRVIQGYFPGGRPRIVQATPASATPSRPQAPASVQASPGTPLRPRAPQPILPQRATPSAVQPHAGDAFPLPGNLTLKPRGSGQPLPEPIQKKMESFFNTSFANVRVHVGHEASSIGALAFTHGTDLYFAPGQYNPQTTQGQQLLGHELTHVVQQRAGRVRNPLGAGVAVVQDPALEAEADRMGLRAASAALPIQGKPASTGRIGVSSHAASPRPNAVAANGAILPQRSLAPNSLQRKPGPVLPRRQSVAGKPVRDPLSASLLQQKVANANRPVRLPIQTKLRVLETRRTLSSLADARDVIGSDTTPLETALNKATVYTVKTNADLMKLHEGKEADVLLPQRHVIGEQHNMSQFDRIAAEWPGVPTMGEGEYTVREQAPKMKDSGSGPQTFRRDLQGQGVPKRGIDNFHAAAIARLTGFLVIWNTYNNQATRTLNVTGHLTNRVKDAINVINAYTNVSVSVYLQAHDDVPFLVPFETWYEGPLERAYGKMWELLRTEDSRKAEQKLKQINSAVEARQAIPTINPDECDCVRRYLVAMINAAGEILRVTYTGATSEAAVSREVSGVSNYFSTNAQTLDMQSALNQIGATRERIMGEQILTLDMPGLVKVGQQHLAGLRSMNLANSTLYDNFTDFEAALKKKADEL